MVKFIRIALPAMLALASCAFAQTQTLALGSTSIAAGGTASISLNLTASNGAPAAVQWRTSFLSSSLTAIQFTPSAAAQAAGKTVACVNNNGFVDCILAGVNTNPIPNGPIATATVTLAGLVALPVPLTMSNTRGVTASGVAISSTAVSGLISILAAPTPVPTTYTISGNISSGGGATVSLTGSASRTVTADGSGNYSFTGLANGSYMISASKSGYTMSPSNRTVSINGANVPGVNFSATQQTQSGWSISGRVTSGGGAVVSLSGNGFQTVVADGSGNYRFSGVGNGSYMVTPSKAGLALSPSSRSVTVRSSHVAGVNFNSTVTQQPQQPPPPSTWSISGTITSGAGSTVQLTGAASRSATADASGTYRFDGLSNGSYTVTPSLAGSTFNPASRTASVNGANVTGVNFTANRTVSTTRPEVDATVWRDYDRASRSFSTPTLATRQPGELLLAFVTMTNGSGADTVRSVASSGLNWVLVARTNAADGTAEIWGAYASSRLSGHAVTASLSGYVSGSITVMSFSGVDPSSPVGATGSAADAQDVPSVSLNTTRAGSLVLAVGTDPRNGFTPVPVSGQSLVHAFRQSNTSHWVQRLNASVDAAGTRVTIRETSPQFSRFNMTAVEVRGTAGVNSDAPLRSALPGSAETEEGDEASAKRQAGPMLANAATQETGPACSPGGWALLMGQGFTTKAPAKAADAVLPTELSGVRVDVNGRSAPLLAAAENQLLFQCPVLPADVPLEVAVMTDNGSRLPVEAGTMQVAAPGLFTHDGTQQAVAQIASTNELVLPERAQAETIESGRPALPGEHIRLFPTGLGEAELALPAGTVAPLDRIVRLRNGVTVVLDGREITPDFAGLAPGTAGLFQVDFAIPRDLAGGLAVPLYLKVRLGEGQEILSNLVTIPVSTPRAE